MVVFDEGEGLKTLHGGFYDGDEEVRGEGRAKNRGLVAIGASMVVKG